MKTEFLGVRLDFETNDALERKCENLNISKSEYVRILIQEALI